MATLRIDMTPSKRRGEGRRAYHDGDTNPYVPKSSHYDDWEDGWAEACKNERAENAATREDDDLVSLVMCEVTDVRSLVEMLVDRGVIT